MSLNQWIASAVAQKVGAIETAADFFRQRVGAAKLEDLHSFLARAPDRKPDSAPKLVVLLPDMLPALQDEKHVSVF